MRLALQELIGKRARIEKSSSKEEQGMEGVVVDETKHTLVLQTANGRKQFQKKGRVFFFIEENERIDGSKIIFRPEERTKKLAREKRLEE